MRTINLISLCLGISTLLPLPSQAQMPPKREFRGAWIATVTNLDWPSTPGLGTDLQKTQLRSILDQLKSNGITAIVFQVRPECDALYASPFEPWSYWLTGSQGSPPSPFYDPLEFAVDEAHKRGMELHAWFNPYRARRQQNTYPLAANSVIVQHPSWVITCPDNYKFLDPGLPQVQQFVAGIIADVVRRYDVDGVHMDDYFYPYPEHSFTNQDATTFATYPRGFSDIGNWRRDNVNQLMRMIRDSLALIKPYVKIGMSPFGIWKSGTPPGITGLSAYSSIYCDAIAWLHEGTVDYLTPQLYWKIGGSQDYVALSTWWSDSTSAYGRHLYPGEAPYHILDGNPSYNWRATEMVNQLKVNRANPKIGGSVYFRANMGVNDNRDGFTDSLRNTYFKYRSLHPVMAWKDVVSPLYPRDLRYARLPQSTQMALQWEVPLTAPDGDSASRYAVYRFDHRPAASELDDPRNLVSIEGQRSHVPSLTSGGITYFVVTALDRNYNESDTSNVLMITPPAPPVLAWPADGTTNLPESLQVIWNTSPMAGVYHVQVSTDPTFASGILVNDSTLIDTTRLIANMDGQTPYFWRVRAGNPAGYSAFSAPFALRLGTPKAPVLASPVNGSTNIALTPTLAWHPSETGTTYQVQIGPFQGFTTPVADSTGLTDTTFTYGPLILNRIYIWHVRAFNALGKSLWSSTWNFRTVTSVDVAADQTEPVTYGLSQNYPNPFNPVTTIRFSVPAPGNVSLRVYDVLGREVATLVDEPVTAGIHTVTWNATGAASGVYYCRMAAGSFTEIRRMLLLR